MYRSSSLTRASSFGGSGYSSGLSRSSSVGGRLHRSSSSIFRRNLDYSTNSYTPPLHAVAVQRNTPHWSDKYPYVRYSYGNKTSVDAGSGIGILASSAHASRDHYTQRGRPLSRYLDSAWSAYGSQLRTAPAYGTSNYSGVRSQYRPYRPLEVDDAVKMYKNRFMTSGTLSKYWLSSTTWQSRREKERNLSRSAAQGTYHYATRYTNRFY